MTAPKVPPDVPPTRSWGRWSIAGAVVLLTVHAVLAWTMRLPALIGGDDASYLALASALRSGSYVELWTLGHPAHAMYPPVFPAWLAMVGATGAAHLPLAVAMNVGLSVLFLALAATLAGRVAPSVGVALLVVCAPNPALVYHAGRVLSEPLFGVLVMATLLELTAPTGGRSRTVIAGALALAAALTRSIGVALVVAVLVEWMLSRRWRAVGALALAAGVTVGAWLMWTVRAPERVAVAGSSYVADAVYAPVPPGQEQRATPPSLVTTLVGRATTNVPAYAAHAIPWAMSLPQLPNRRLTMVLWLSLGIVAGGIGLLGLARRFRLVVVTGVVYGGVLLLWPFVLSRFVLPLLPLLVLALLAGAWWGGGRWRSPRSGTIALWTLAGLLSIGSMADDASRLAKVSACDRRAEAVQSAMCVTPRQRDFFAALDEVRRVSVDATPLLTAQAATAYAYLARVSVRHAEALQYRDPDAFLAFLRARRVEYVVLSHLDLSHWGLAPMLSARCRAFDRIATFATHAAVLRLVPVDAPRPDANAAEAACVAIRQWAQEDWTAQAGGPRPLWW